MEGNSVSTSGLEWENLALYSEKPIEFQEQICFSMSSSSGSNSALCRNDLRTGSSREAMGSLPPYKNTYEDVLGMQNTRGSGEPMIGLRLGRPNGDSFFHAKSSVSSLPASSTPTKRSRASYHNVQNPCCQVEGCNLDLKSAKDYHRRHRICESHSKSPKVIVAGMERRFCQQCSRFHDLSEFDDKKRSCRRRLSDHNARRRRVQPESIQLSSTGLSSALYDQRLQQNLLLNGLPISNTNPSWENATTSMLRHTRDSFVRPSKPSGYEGTLCFSSDEIHNSMSSLQMDSNPRNILDQCLHVSTTNSSQAPDLLNAHSLLSSNSWSLNEGDSSSMEGLVHGHYDPSIRHMNPDSHHLTLFHSNNIPVTPVSLVNSVNFHNHTTSAHQHEYQLFRASYNTGGGFYSDERNL